MAGRIRAGAASLIALGLLLIGSAVVLATPVAAEEEFDPSVNFGKVCNNQHNDSKDCEGDKYHGDVDTEFTADGDLKFTITAREGWTVGWRQLYICIPGSPEPEQGAQCEGNTASVLSTGDYEVTKPTPNTENRIDVEFACATEVVAVVDKSVFPAGQPVQWTLHLNTCGGGTDEAFGTSTPKPPGEEFVYQCKPPTNVTTTSATLNAFTDDSIVSEAVFTITGQSPLTDSTGEDGTFSVDVTGLDPNTVYTYSVQFNDAEETIGTAEGCHFATAAVPPTYACAAPENVTQTSARLRGTTDDSTVDAATFSLSGGAAQAGTKGTGDVWYLDVSGLTPGTNYTYTVTFIDGGETVGTSPSCAFTTQAATVTPTPPAPTPAAQPAPAVVAGVEVTRAAPAPAPAVQGVTLAATGSTTRTLALVGVLLVLIGAALMRTTRPVGRHSA